MTTDLPMKYARLRTIWVKSLQVPGIRIKDAAAMLGVSSDTCGGWRIRARSETKRTTGGQRLISGRSLASYLARRGGRGRRSSPARQSMRNHLPRHRHTCRQKGQSGGAGQIRPGRTGWSAS